MYFVKSTGMRLLERLTWDCESICSRLNAKDPAWPRGKAVRQSVQ